MSDFAHFMGRDPGQPVKTRGPPHGQGGRRIIVLIATTARELHGQWPGPARENTWAASWAGVSGPRKCPHIEGRGAARPIRLRLWAAVHPGPSIFQVMGRECDGPAHLLFHNSRPGSDRPGLSAHDKPWLLPHALDRKKVVVDL